MKFFVIEHSNGETVGCELKRKDAVKRAEAYGLKPDEYTIDTVEVEVTADNIRRLLGNLGGYAK